MDTRPPNLWFILSYLLLVAIVAIGFYWQAQTIDQVKENSAAIEQQVEINHEAVRLLCGLFHELASAPLDAEVDEAFVSLGIDCSANGLVP